MYGTSPHPASCGAIRIRAFSIDSSVFCSKNGQYRNVKVYTADCFSWKIVLTYNNKQYETWKPTKEDLQKLNVFHLDYCRQIFNIYLWTKTSNMEVHRISRQHPVSDMIEVRRWPYPSPTLGRAQVYTLVLVGHLRKEEKRTQKTWQLTALDQLRSFWIQSCGEAAEMAKDRR